MYVCVCEVFGVCLCVCGSYDTALVTGIAISESFASAFAFGSGMRR